MRTKTGSDRRCPLWKETQDALAIVIGDRTEGLVFRTKFGATWEPQEVESKNGKQYHNDPIAKEFAKLKKGAGIVGRGKGFYCLRHMFQTISDETKDFVPVWSIMGHPNNSISGHYREFIPDDRLHAVADHVPVWLSGCGK